MRVSAGGAPVAVSLFRRSPLAARRNRTAARVEAFERRYAEQRTDVGRGAIHEEGCPLDE